MSAITCACAPSSATNDVTDYGVKKAVENLPPLRDKLATICDNYLTVQQDILETFVDRGQLRKLTEPTVLPSGKRIPGLKLDNPRQLALMHALVRFAHIAAGSTFTTAELYPYVLAALQTILRPIQSGFAAVRSFQIESQGVGRETSRNRAAIGSAHRGIPFVWCFSNSSNAFTHRSLPGYFSPTGPTPNSSITSEPSWIASIKRS